MERGFPFLPQAVFQEATSSWLLAKPQDTTVITEVYSNIKCMFFLSDFYLKNYYEKCERYRKVKRTQVPARFSNLCFCSVSLSFLLNHDIVSVSNSARIFFLEIVSNRTYSAVSLIVLCQYHLMLGSCSNFSHCPWNVFYNRFLSNRDLIKGGAFYLVVMTIKSF